MPEEGEGVGQFALDARLKLALVKEHIDARENKLIEHSSNMGWSYLVTPPKVLADVQHLSDELVQFIVVLDERLKAGQS